MHIFQVGVGEKPPTRLHTQLKNRIQQVQRWKKVPPGEAVERMWDEMLAANRRFDERFNAAFFRTKASNKFPKVVVKVARKMGRQVWYLIDS